MNDIIETFIHDHLFLHLVLIAVSMTAKGGKTKCDKLSYST